MNAEAILTSSSRVRPPPIKHRRSGVVVADRQAVHDDTGPFHPLGMTFFWGLWGWRYERGRCEQNLAYIAPHVDYLRILGDVGWTGREIDSSWSGYEDLVADFADTCWDTYGLRLEVTAWGGSNRDPIALVHRLCNVFQARAEILMDLECANESFQNGPPNSTLEQMTTIVQGRLPNLCALSSPGTDWTAMKASAAKVNARAFSLHTSRGPGDLKWRMVRQGWDFKDLRVPVHSNEPPGPNSSVATLEHPLQLAMLRAVGVMCGGPCTVLHVGDMVAGVEDPHYGRHPNIWEVSNIDAIMRGMRGVEQLLPTGVENWTKANTGWTPPNPVAPFQPGAYWQQGAPNGVNKAYSARSGKTWIQMPCGIMHYVDMTASHNCTYEVFDPLTLQVVLSGQAAQGQTIRLPGAPDSMAAYIIQGFDA